MNTAPHSNERCISDEVERRRVLFEQTWGQPSALSIEQHLNAVPSAERSDLLRELLYIEFEFTQRQGSKVLLENYLSRFSQYESIVREVAVDVGQYTVFKRRNIAGYTLLGEIGRGGMGVVYRAKNDLLNNFVAFKMINRKMVGHPEALRRFTRELEMIGQLKHPNIVEAKYAGIAPDGSPFLVMEFIDGVTLNRWSQQNPPPQKQKTQSEKQQESLRIAEVCTMIRDVASGLQAIHEAGLVHRDIKPGNVMLHPDGRVKILDLGLAKLREHSAEGSAAFETQTQQGHFLGTPGYIAPEQMYSATHVDIRADIYSLGCTFFFLLHGCSPAENHPKEFSTQLPKKLQAILDRMLATDPAVRFQEPHEVVATLDVFLGSSQTIRFGKIAVASTIAAFACVALVLFAPSFDNRYNAIRDGITTSNEIIKKNERVTSLPKSKETMTSLPDLTAGRYFSGHTKPIIVTTSGSIKDFDGSLTDDLPSFSPSDNLYVYYAITNIGSASTSIPFQATLTLSGGNLLEPKDVNKTFFKPGLQYGAHAFNTTGICLEQLEPGSYTLTLVIDPDNEISESDKTNNTFVKTFTVVGTTRQPDAPIPDTVVKRADLTPHRPPEWSAPVIVTNLFSKATTDLFPITEEDNLSVGISFKNNSSVATTTSIDVQLTLSRESGPSIATRTVPFEKLGAGYSVSVPSCWEIGKLSPGTYSITMIIDPDNGIPESNKTNNIFVKTFTVVSALQRADLIPYHPPGWSAPVVVSDQSSDATTDLFPISEGDSLFVSISFRNDSLVAITTPFNIQLTLSGKGTPSMATCLIPIEKISARTNNSLPSYWDIGKLTPGIYTITMVIDPDNATSKSNDINNFFVKTFTVIAASQ